MAKLENLSSGEKQRIVELLDRWATEAVQEAYPNGSVREMTFAEIEEMGSSIGRMLAMRFSEKSLFEHSEGTPEEAACPQCGRLCRVTRHGREFQTTEGNIRYAEPACHCEACRRDFFPESHGASDR